MQAGKLNRRVVIQKKGPSEDELGEPIPADWENFATVWADIQHRSGLETVKSDMDVSVIQASIRIRYRTDITAGMRVKHGAVIYDIRAVLPDASGRVYTDLVAQQGANQG
ncbi:MAG TPA: phage head closure protein [Burkholderiaceae bacterium]|nr:phage head closure protein [Burkholderiaceae bacterium]